MFDANGVLLRYRLLGIVADKMRDDEKVTKIWNSDEDKSGKATPIDRILIICPEDSSVGIYAKNKNIIWESMHTGGGLDESK